MPDKTLADELAEALEQNIAAFNKIDADTPFSTREPEWWLAWSQQCQNARAILTKYRNQQKETP